MENPFSDWENPDEPFDYHAFTEPGIYMYIMEDGHDLNNPPTSISCNSSGFLNANNMLLLHPDGKKDYSLLFNEDSLSLDTVRSNPGIWPPKYDAKIITTADNPIAGTTVRESYRMDNPGRKYPTINKLNGHIDYEPNNNKDSGINEYFGLHWNEAAGKLYTDASVEKTAFTVDDELSINGIFPILNFRKFNSSKNPSNNNRWEGQQMPFTLTGLKVEVLSKATVDGADKYTLRISKDDWEFNSNKRWCDAIILPEDETLTVTDQSNLSLELSGTVNRNTPHPKNRNDPFIKNFVDPTILTAQTNSSIVIENNSCINVKEESTLKINENALLHLTSGGFIHIKDEDAKLVLDDNAILQMGQNAEIIVRDGGSLVINTDDISLAFASSKIIIKAGGILTTTTNQSFNFDGPGKLVIEEGAIIDMPFNLVGQGANHIAIFFDNDSATGEFPFIEMEHDFYLTDCEVWHHGGSHITINSAKVKLDNIAFINGNGPSTALIGNDLTYFLSKDCTFNGFDYGIVLNDYTSPPVNPSNPCSNPINPTFAVRDCDFTNITYNGISCTDAYKLYAYNNTFSNSVLGNSDQKAIYAYNNNIEVVNNVIDNFNTGVYLNGGSFGNKKLRLSGGEISYCHYGVETQAANADIKYCANIHHNFYGIHSTATAMQELTVGRIGGISITNNHVAIRGVNVTVDIDAISAKSANGGVHHPNDLSNSFIFFDLSYPNTTSPIGLSARGNYWGSLNGCGAGIDATGSYTVPANFNINDSQFENAAPITDCHSLETICNGATAPGNTGNTGTLNTNFNLIYNISNDYLEEEAYSSAYFGYSLVADFKDEPVYNLLDLSDQSTVILSKIKQTTLEPHNDTAVDCRVSGNPALLFPEVTIIPQKNDDYDLIESVSPNPFTHYITLSTYLKNTAYVVEVFNAYDINGRSLLQLKTETNRLKIDVSKLKPGIYALKVTDETGKTDYVEILKAY